MVENPELSDFEYHDTLASLCGVKWGKFQRLGLGL